MNHRDLLDNAVPEAEPQTERPMRGGRRRCRGLRQARAVVAYAQDRGRGVDVHLDERTGGSVVERVADQVAQCDVEQHRVAGQRKACACQRQLLATRVGLRRQFGDHAAGEFEEVDRQGRIQHLGAAGARQCQQVVEHLRRAAAVVVEPLQRLVSFGLGERPAEGARVQRQRGERRTQLVRDFAGQLPLALQRRLLPIDQRVDRMDHRFEFGMALHGLEREVTVDIERADLLREPAQWREATAHCQPERDRDHRQQQQTGLGDLAGDVFGEIVARTTVQQHHHLALRADRVPARKRAPLGLLCAELQIGEAFVGVERRERRLAGV